MKIHVDGSRYGQNDMEFDGSVLDVLVTVPYQADDAIANPSVIGQKEPLRCGVCRQNGKLLESHLY